MDPLSSGIRPRRERTPMAFDRLVDGSGEVQGVSREDVRRGDTVMAYTRNSVYTLRRLDDGRFEVSGGWFDREPGAPVVLGITGCTWGGSAVRRDLVAGCGMRIEFSNRVLTSTVLRVVHFPGKILN